MSREPFETMPDVMDAKQLAQALQISKAGAYNLLNRGTPVSYPFCALECSGKEWS